MLIGTAESPRIATDGQAAARPVVAQTLSTAALSVTVEQSQTVRSHRSVIEVAPVAVGEGIIPSKVGDSSRQDDDPRKMAAAMTAT